ncbi:methyltransferase domain-containing protein [Phyllobacterium sp. SYP-B3895]|uniref:class I SAM-dependent methyltransferase n=1 Tax=Phyllobacterium sp. SYP-B3895 TaxID=2663240 RepID=UPI0012999810|nr:class I SAM-dependent methyltransferase [Phyllobacterium sp. SYP-B3895]MRG55902.1 methyltransferase domain-containing protein [Phyllobacterium sp. SYP-B3895]
MEQSDELQRTFWNKWNSENRQHDVGEISRRQSQVIEEWLVELGRRDLNILEVGCGNGWFCPTLAKFGNVTGTDISDEVLSASRTRWPQIKFVAGDFAKLDFAPMSFDVLVSLEVLSHVADQNKFFARLAELLKPGGHLFLATQNRPVLQNYCRVPTQQPGQLRKWVDRTELASLAGKHFEIESLFSITPIAHKHFRRLLTSNKVNRLTAPLLGHGLRDFMEKRDWGWTLMLKAKKRDSR